MLSVLVLISLSTNAAFLQLLEADALTTDSIHYRYNRHFQNGRKHEMVLSARHNNAKDAETNLYSDAFLNPPPKRHEHEKRNRPIPVMPSRIFQELAQSQLELLANSLISTVRPGSSKVKTTALYLPQENVLTGQLEFTPAILYPMRDRVFIASDADSGVAPTLPPTLTKLPGFSHAKALMPGYPMVSSLHGGRPADIEGSVSIGVVEEVFCDRKIVGACALSVPLFSGFRTLGVLLVSPADVPDKSNDSVWTELDKQQVSLAARSLALALSMDQENKAMVDQNEQIAQALSDSMHQLKNPLQALRTYGKLLQRQIASDDDYDYDASFGNYKNSASSQQQHQQQQRRLTQLADHLMVQSDRLVQRLLPVDSMVERLAATSAKRHLFLLPATIETTPAGPESNSLALPPSSTHWLTPLIPPKQPKKDTTVTLSDDDDDVLISSSPLRIGNSQRPGSVVRMNMIAQRNLERNSPNVVVASEDLPLEMAFVPDVLEPVFCAFAAIAEERAIDFDVQYGEDELPGVYMHSESLQEAVSNILDNAFKYVVLRTNESRNHTTPMVRVFMLTNQEEQQEEGQQAVGVTILVTDNGPGIPQEHVIGGLVFGRGYRVPSTKSRAQGQGLGLSIAQKLVQAMGGELRVVIMHNDSRRRSNSSCRRGRFNLLDGATLELTLWRRSVLLLK